MSDLVGTCPKDVAETRSLEAQIEIACRAARYFELDGVVAILRRLDPDEPDNVARVRDVINSVPAWRSENDRALAILRAIVEGK